MDLSFGRFGLDRATSVIRLDYPQLIAILAAAQAASRTARIESRLARGQDEADTPLQALVAMMNPPVGWFSPGNRLHGSFNPAVAERHRKAT